MSKVRRSLSIPRYPPPPPPPIRVFALLKKFFAQLACPCPPCAESPRRTLAPPKNRGITRQNRPFAPPPPPPKSPATHRPRTPKHPPLTPLHIKKLSKVHSTLLTLLPRGCILEYMRLKEAAQTTPHGAVSVAPTASKTFKLSRLALEEAGH